MTLSSVNLVYFSPTKTTKNVVEAIGRGMGPAVLRHIDLTPPDSGSKTFADFDHEPVILGAPVYRGRLPEEAARRFSRLRGKTTPAVVVVLYGNREYEDALLELRDLSVRLGFVPIAGGAFVGEHSFQNEAFPIASGRPDSRDLEMATEFGRAVRQKMEAIENISCEEPIGVPGKSPYKDRRITSQECATTIQEVCISCGTCMDVCPTAAITLNGNILTDPKSCILCCACVKNCPTSARVMAVPRIKRVTQWLSKNCSTPKKPETFI